MVGGDPACFMAAFPGGAVPLIQSLRFDTAQAYNPYTLAALTRLMPTEHIMFGSDFPAASPLDTVKGLRALPSATPRCKKSSATTQSRFSRV